MDILVVYDTVFGNTGEVATRIATALEPGGKVGIHKVGEAPSDSLADVKLLVVGSPTRAFQPTPATKQWIKSIGAGVLDGVAVAAFDTRMSIEDVDNKLLTFLANRFGYAAETILKLLIRKGAHQVAEPEGFIVTGNEGPMQEGELDRAAAWAGALATAR